MKTNAPVRHITLPCEPARSFRQRLLGLLGRAPPAPGCALWLQPCRAVHTVGMRYAIDVIFLDDMHRVVRVVARLRPMRVAGCLRARGVLEMAAGGAAHIGVVPGVRITLVDDHQR